MGLKSLPARQIIAIRRGAEVDSLQDREAEHRMGAHRCWTPSRSLLTVAHSYFGRGLTDGAAAQSSFLSLSARVLARLLLLLAGMKGQHRPCTYSYEPYSATARIE